MWWRMVWRWHALPMRLDELDRSLRSVGTSKAAIRNSPKRPVEVREDRDGNITPFWKDDMFQLKNLFHCGRNCFLYDLSCPNEHLRGFWHSLLSWPFFFSMECNRSLKVSLQRKDFKLDASCPPHVLLWFRTLSAAITTHPTSFNTSCFLCLKVENPQSSDISPGSISKLFASKVVDPSSLQENSADLSLVLW